MLSEHSITMRGRKIQKAVIQTEAYHSSSQEALEQEEESDGPLQIKDFSLTHNQYLMIMNKLPKMFSLQPVKNIHKSRKLLSQITEKPTKRHEKERKQQQKQRKEMIRRDSTKMTLKSNESAEIDEQPSIITNSVLESRKSQRIFLRQKKVYYDLDKESEPQNPSVLPTEVIEVIVPPERVEDIPLCSEVFLESIPQKVQQKLEPAALGETQQKPIIQKTASKRGRKARLKSVDTISKPNSEAPSRDCKSEEKSLLPPFPPPQASQAYEQKFAQEWQILKSLQGHSMIEPFTSPVDQVRDCAPGYFLIVKKPMDLATIQGKLRNYVYRDSGQFHEDVQQMWKNCRIFNKPGSAMVRLTGQLEKYYQNLRNGKKMKRDGSEHKRGRKR